MELQRNTSGHTRQQPDARDYIMTAETGRERSRSTSD